MRKISVNGKPLTSNLSQYTIMYEGDNDTCLDLDNGIADSDFDVLII